MAEMSREQIEQYRTNLLVAANESPTWVRDINALCDLALRSLEAQPDAGRIQRLHGLVEQLAGRFRGYLPWGDEKRDSTVRSHEMFIEDTIRKADALALPSPDQRPERRTGQRRVSIEAARKFPLSLDKRIHADRRKPTERAAQQEKK